VFLSGSLVVFRLERDEILAGDQRESRDEHEAVTTDTKAGSVDDDSFVFDITEHNYIDWSDICVQTTSTQVKLEDNNIQRAVHDSSRSSLKTTNDPERNTMEQCNLPSSPSFGLLDIFIYIYTNVKLYVKNCTSNKFP
jgi:hypothetical protein